MSTIKIILLGPPATGKSTLAAAAPLLFPRCVIAFDMEGVGPKTDGRNETNACKVMLTAQRELFHTLDRTEFNQSLVVSPGFVNHREMIPDGWWKVFLLPYSREHYYAAVRKRNPKEPQKYEGHYTFTERMWEECKEDGRSIRVPRIDHQGKEATIPDTWQAIALELGMDWPVNAEAAVMLSRPG